MAAKPPIARPPVLAFVLLAGAALQMASGVNYERLWHAPIGEVAWGCLVLAMPFAVLGAAFSVMSRKAVPTVRVSLLAMSLLFTAATMWWHLELWRRFPPGTSRFTSDFGWLYLFSLQMGAASCMALVGAGLRLLWRAPARDETEIPR